MYCLISLIFLCIVCVYDIKYKKIPMVLIWAGVICSILKNLLSFSLGREEFIIGVIIGGLSLGISKWSKGGMGVGDGWIILVIGLLKGGYFLLGVMVISSVLAMIYCIGMLLLKKVDRKSRIPFVPFLLIGYLGGLMC